MKPAAERKEIEAAFDIYRKKLDDIPDDLFNVTPPGGGWSYAEVYAHILQSTLGASIALEKCTLSNCKPTNKTPNLLGRLVLLFNRFPPFKIKEPKPVTEKLPALKITKEAAKNLLIKCRQRMDLVMPLLYNAGHHGRIAHPRLGMFNAKQWLKFIRIHLKHHLKQLQRIENKFSAA